MQEGSPQNLFLFIGYFAGTFNVFLKTLFVADWVKPFPTAGCSHTVIHQVGFALEQPLVGDRFFFAIWKLDIGLPFDELNATKNQRIAYVKLGAIRDFRMFYKIICRKDRFYYWEIPLL